MRISKNEKVNQFLKGISAIDEDQFNILEKLRSIVIKVFPQTDERMIYGGIMFSLEEDYGGIFVRKNHISFEFGNGFKMKDPNKILEGEGKFRRHLKIKSITDIEDKNVEFFVKQAV